MELIASGLAFPVGLVATANGELIVGEGGTGCVQVIDDGGARRVLARVEGAPMGVARLASGALVVADNGGKHPPSPSTADEAGADAAAPAVHLVTPDGAVSTLLSEVDGVGLLAPNGVCVDGMGGIWFADSSWDFADDTDERGALAYVAADGATTRVSTHLRFPAGLALDADGDTLYVAEAMAGGVWAFDVIASGKLGQPRLFADLGVDAVPSGLAFDLDGRLLVTGHTSGRVHVFDPAGAERDGFDVGRSSGLGHITFGGADMTTLHIAAAATGEILATAWSTPGLPLRT